MLLGPAVGAGEVVGRRCTGSPRVPIAEALLELEELRQPRLATHRDVPSLEAAAGLHRVRRRLDVVRQREERARRIEDALDGDAVAAEPQHAMRLGCTPERAHSRGVCATARRRQQRRHVDERDWSRAAVRPQSARGVGEPSAIRSGCEGQDSRAGTHGTATTPRLGSERALGAAFASCAGLHTRDREAPMQRHRRGRFGLAWPRACIVGAARTFRSTPRANTNRDTGCRCRVCQGD